MSFANLCVTECKTCLNDIPNVMAQQSTDGEVTLELRNRTTGDCVDLTKFGIGPSASSSSGSSGSAEENHGVTVIAKDMQNSQTLLWSQQATIVDAEKGIIKWCVRPGVETLTSGIFVGEAQVWEHGKRRLNFFFWFTVEPSIGAMMTSQVLSVATVRLFLRDTCPETNHLMDEFDFFDFEIVACMQRVVGIWNETPPPVGTFTVASWKWPNSLITGTIAQLHRIASHHKRRNDLDYTAGGLTVRETADWKVYDGVYKEMWAEFQQWMMRQKISINMNWDLTLSSFYGFGRVR